MQQIAEPGDDKNLKRGCIYRSHDFKIGRKRLKSCRVCLEETFYVANSTSARCPLLAGP